MNACYRIGTWLRHQFTSWNTGGEGIHSPYLFHLVRYVISDDNRYYCWAEIENRRAAMLRAPKLLNVLDYGSGGNGSTQQRLVSHIAKTSLQTPANARIFFRLVNFLSHEKGSPLNIIELGTNLGITTAYLASPNSRNRVTTFEGSPELVDMAQLNWKKLGIRNIRVVLGNIDDTLYSHTRAMEHAIIDVAYIDANHRYEPTVNYFDELVKFVEPKSVFILDDIHHNPEMERAWNTLKNRREVTTTMDFYHFGLLFFEHHYLKKHYILRI